MIRPTNNGNNNHLQIPAQAVFNGQPVYLAGQPSQQFDPNTGLPLIVAGGNGQMPPGVVEVVERERLAQEYDLTEVAPSDRAAILELYQGICTLETNMPLINIKIKADRTFYIVIVSDMDVFLEIDNLHRFLFRDPLPGVILDGAHFDPAQGVMTLRVSTLDVHNGQRGRSGYAPPSGKRARNNDRE